MPKFPVNQKKPLQKKSKGVSADNQKTLRVELQSKPLKYPTNQGDLGILRGHPNSIIPKQSPRPTKMGDSKTNDVSKMRSVMKKQGMLV